VLRPQAEGDDRTHRKPSFVVIRRPIDYRDASLLDQFKVELVTLEIELGMSSR